ncbi:tyrosine-protein phosphatase [Rhizobium sp. TH2]|uniref:tyrosine-protein phosphatase n=1 Tax=Rhizobium sp. TH2 TaxID=2775403 RepID=UPI0021588A93|nr:tyrosine-protein phosphatase [Rhizobium sp. TH2]UVC10428.1 tyrosine-protein phosphatase [Rhizobium sp. TH2]
MKRLRRIAILTVMLLVGASTWLGLQYLTGNVHEVIAGQFYRSGQLSGSGFADVIERYKIKTVLNLRGESHRQWYQDEVGATTRLGVRHIDFKMSALKELTLEETKQLVTMMRDAPKPLLIHCEGGADRSGFAAVLYLQQIAGINEDIAELQLSPYFGHFGISWLTGTQAMDESWEKFEDKSGIEATGFL